ncbi:hypothetical protein BJ508DRAFT_53936 [Ascobolus immersus RN42]|uniref:Uncharacterized protein n=1 Tax=Ascobolus immersus RN42 TaxID=1160509 RepID=A0A3N4HGK1_ASCIM|nr:hypothetical protein BJ508DRAFT_53936 [Ascobolus immersus RN42]
MVVDVLAGLTVSDQLRRFVRCAWTAGMCIRTALDFKVSIVWHKRFPIFCRSWSGCYVRLDESRGPTERTIRGQNICQLLPFDILSDYWRLAWSCLLHHPSYAYAIRLGFLFFILLLTLEEVRLIEMSNATFFDFNDDDLDFNYRALLEVPDGAVKQEEVASTAAPPEESTGTGQELRGIEYSQKVVVENVLEKFESMKRAGLLKYPTGYKNDNMVNEGGEAKRSETEEEKVARLKAVALAHVKRYEEALVAFCNLPTIKGTDEEKLKQEYRYSQRFVFWFCAMVILDASFLAACVREEQATAGGARGSGSFGYKDPAAAAIASFWRGFAEAADKMMGKYMQDICEAEFCAVMSPKPFMSARQNGFRTIAALAYHLSGTECTFTFLFSPHRALLIPCQILSRVFLISVYLLIMIYLFI